MYPQEYMTIKLTNALNKIKFIFLLIKLINKSIKLIIKILLISFKQISNHQHNNSNKH